MTIRQYFRKSKILFYTALLLILYLVRIPFYPLIGFLQTQTANWIAAAFWAVYAVMQTSSLFCPVFMFATALAVRREGWRSSFGIFLIYAVMELTFQTLFSGITYHSLPLSQFITVLGVNLLNWAIFSAAMLALLLLSLLLLQKKQEKSEDRFFSFRSGESICLLGFTVLFFLQKATMELIGLYQLKQENAWLEASDIRTAVVNIVVFFLILSLCFLASTGILYYQKRKYKIHSD